MANRYICKACGRKREQHHLVVIGLAHNNQNIWLCKHYHYSTSMCNVDKARLLLDKFNISSTDKIFGYVDADKDFLQKQHQYKTNDALIKRLGRSRSGSDVTPGLGRNSLRSDTNNDNMSTKDFINSLSPEMRDYFNSLGLSDL